MSKTLGSFKLEIQAGSFTDSEIIVMLGENGTGKTTFIRMLAGNLKPDDEAKMPALNISYKPQKISPKSEKTVQNLLYEKIRAAFTHPQFATDVLKPLQMERLYDQEASKSFVFFSFLWKSESIGGLYIFFTCLLVCFSLITYKCTRYKDVF